MKINLTRFLFTAVLCLLGGSAFAATSKPMNILFIFSDDHATQAISA